MKSKHLIIFLLINTFSACHNSQTLEVSSNIDESKNTLIKLDASWFEPKSEYKQFDLEYIPLETSEKPLIGYIDDIKVHDDVHFILDKNVAKGIFIFDAAGKFINSIRTSGRGPQEIFRINDFTVDTNRNRIIISDLSLRKVLEFDYHCQFIAEYSNNLWFSNIEYLNDNTFLYYLSHYGLNENNTIQNGRGPLVSIGNINGELSKTLIDIPSKPSLVTIVENFHSIKSINLFFSKVLDPTIYELNSSSLLLEKIYSFDFAELNIPEQYLSIKTNNYRTYARDTEFSQLKSFAMTSNHLVVTFENPKAIPGQKILISAIINKKDTKNMSYFLPTNLPDEKE
jgi:hypothetical protein